MWPYLIAAFFVRKWDAFIAKASQYLLKKSYKAALADAEKLKKETGQKIYILLWKGDFEAIPKANFKAMWQQVPGMKKYTLQQWEKQVVVI
jgi:hypothetical protein